jgi:hypothetical protein
MSSLEFITYGDAERVSQNFRITADKATPLAMRGALYEIAGEMMIAEGTMFRSQGRRFGGSWKHLKPDTVRKKGHGRILFTAGSKPKYDYINNNALYRSLTYPNAPYQILNIFGYDLEFGTERPHSWVHQRGSAKRNIPPRPFLAFGRGDRERWNVILRRHLRYAGGANPSGQSSGRGIGLF